MDREAFEHHLKDHPELSELIGRLRSGRGGQLLNVYKLLLNSPVLAGTWFEHVSAVRWRTELDGLTRELASERQQHGRDNQQRGASGSNARVDPRLGISR